jgi:hypothetical protein
VKVFLDECVDWRLARDLVGHDVKTAGQMGEEPEHADTDAAGFPARCECFCSPGDHHVRRGGAGTRE